MTDAPTGFGTLSHTQDDYSVMDFLARQVVNGIATASLVKVIAVTGTRVDVRPLVGQTDGKGNVVDHGIIHDLPTLSLRAGPCAIRATPRADDIGIAVFCHSDISSAKATQDYAGPPSRRRFDWSDGVYLGGVLGADPTTIIEVDADNNVAITAPTIKITGNVEVTGDLSATGTITGTTDVVGGGKHLKTHTHAGVTTGTGTSGAPT
jgi:hypothetical protein